MHMTHSTWKVCWLDFLNCYIRFPNIHLFIIIIIIIFKNIWFPSDYHLSFTCSSFHHKGTAWRLCWEGEACSWVWWLWVQGVWQFHLYFYLFSISLHFCSKYVSEAFIFPLLQIWLWLEQRRSKQKPSANAHNCCFIQDALLAGPGVIPFKCLTF
jgi:hypothetical protein